MARQLPPLKSLTSFEAAARHCSFTLAAKELNVTQSAISHQVRILEENLNVALFNRQSHNLSLTSIGKLLLPELTGSLNQMATVIEQIRRLQNSNPNTLSVRVAPSFALAWLSPRLGDFWQKYPDIELCLYHSHSPTNFEIENIDMSIAYGKGDWPNVKAELLMKLDFFPVCSPKLIQDKNQPINIEDLKDYNLLHETDYQYWADWIAVSGIEDLNPYQGSMIDDTNVLMQAAIEGKGIALGSSIFVERHLKDGSLIRLSDTALEYDEGYYIVYPKESFASPLINAFKDWIFSQTL